MVIVPGRPSPSALLWWVMCDAPQAPQATCVGDGEHPVALYPLFRPGDPPVVSRIYVAIATGLSEDTAYELRVQHPDGSVAIARSRTFPAVLAVDQPFTIAFGSCYHLWDDQGLAFYPPWPHRDDTDPIRLRVLTGDQVYMDFPAPGWLPSLLDEPDPWWLYEEQWRSRKYRSFLAASPTMMLADDHEFWNDYPHGNAHLAWDEDDVGGRLGLAIDRAFQVFQVALNMDPVQVTDSGQASPHQVAANIDALLASGLPPRPPGGNVPLSGGRTGPIDHAPLPMFLLDTRTRRTRYDDPSPGMIPADWMKRTLHWLGNLQSPGVLFISQPMIEKSASWFERFAHTMGDVNHPDYTEDFRSLWHAILGAPYSVLIVSGDIHWSRLYQLTSRQGKQVYEVISSPISHIPGKSSPDEDDDGAVKWDGGSAAWTKHYGEAPRQSYSTLTFTRRGDGSLRVIANVWDRHPQAAATARRVVSSAFTLA